MRTILTITLMAFAFFTKATASDTAWTLRLVKKGYAFVKNDKDYLFNVHGFYLYKNCMYDFTLEDGTQYLGRVLDFKPDSIFVTTCFNKNVCGNYDTLAKSIKDLKQLKLIADRSFGIFTSISLKHYDCYFEHDTALKHFDSEWLQIYTNDSSKYEVAPYITSQGLDRLYEENGRTHHFFGTGGEKYIPEPEDSTYTVRNYIWYTPNLVEKINGVAIGFAADNIKNDYNSKKDSLEINGCNIELNVLNAFDHLFLSFKHPKFDTAKYQSALVTKTQLKVNGINLSALGTVHEAQLKGLNLAGMNSIVYTLKGLSISGLSTFSFLMKGLCISGFKNRAVEAKGVQIALYNKATKMKGIQIGLWNDNGIRKMPLFNWNFGSK